MKYIFVVGLAMTACGGGSDSVDRADREKACLSLGSCAELFVDPSSCLTFDELWPEEQIRCVVDAQADCAAVRACIGLGGASDPACQPQCDGNVRVYCDFGDAWRIDCAVFPFSGGPLCVEDV